MTYTVQFSPVAHRQIQAISKSDLPQVVSLLISIFQEPRHPGAVLCRRAASHHGYALGDIYVLATGNYRISYEIIESQERITVAAIEVLGGKSMLTRLMVNARALLSMEK